jgi:hypothetical protein
VDTSVSCAHPTHARKVFWKGLGETFFSKKVFPFGGGTFFKKSIANKKGKAAWASRFSTPGFPKRRGQKEGRADGC